MFLICQKPPYLLSVYICKTSLLEMSQTTDVITHYLLKWKGKHNTKRRKVKGIIYPFTKSKVQILMARCWPRHA